MRRFVQEVSELSEKVVSINPVAKTTKGGRTRSFRALVVVGDAKGKVGVGLGKAYEVAEAIKKASAAAKKSMMTVPMVGTTIPHEVNAERAGSRPKPAARHRCHRGGPNCGPEAAG